MLLKVFGRRGKKQLSKVEAVIDYTKFMRKRL